MKKFRRLLRALKAAYPEFRVTIRRSRITDYGHCGRYQDAANHFWIQINRELDESLACHALVHEFAHVPSFAEWERTGVEHNDVWSLHHGECYRIFEKTCLED
jgi:hypothetical protein